MEITPLVQRQVEEEELQMQPLEEEEEELQMKGLSDSAPEVSSGIESRLNSSRGGVSQPMSDSTRAYFEPRFGADFSSVRVHTGSDAVHMNRDLNAQAFTLGRDIYFGAGKHNTETSSGKRLLAHELTHVVQQRGNHSGSSTMALQRIPDAGQQPNCPNYASGEVRQSRTSGGFLNPDVIRLGPRRLLIADFGAGWSSLKNTTRRDALYHLRGLRDSSLQIDIVGYSDCVGSDSINIRLRHGRARAIGRLLPGRLRRNAFIGMQALGQYVNDNTNSVNRARNRGVVIEWSPPRSPSPQPGESPLRTAEGEIQIQAGDLPEERLYASIVPRGLWWFNGGTPIFSGLYPTEERINLQAGSGNFECSIVRGSNKVRIVSGGSLTTRLSQRDLTHLTLRAVGKSRRQGDVLLEVVYTPAGGGSPGRTQIAMQTRAPHRMTYLGVDHLPFGAHGFRSAHYLRLLDNFNTPIPYMTVNEDFTRGRLRRGISAHWRTAIDARTRGSGTTSGSGVWVDKYEAGVVGGAPPPGMRPIPSHSHPGRRSVLVATFRHDWYAGDPNPGRGVHISRHLAYFFDDHGEYRNIKSPP